MDAIKPKVRSVENMVARAQAIAGKKKGAGPACPTCHVKLWLSFFFDGTGNNKWNDFPNSHSNVAALFDAHVNDPANGITSFYYEGLGTPFEFSQRYEKRTIHNPRVGPVEVEDIGYKESGNSSLGLGFANGITERLEKALFDFDVAIQNWQLKRRVDEINLTAFGFSRGATEARAFMHWVAAHSKVQNRGGKLSYDGIPLNVKFLGIFDTVESVGMAADNKMPELIKTTIPAYVEKCTHIVAANELRHAFPLTLTNGGQRTIVYPGMHADIGGGYKVIEQGRKNHLARLALLQMHDEARAAGLKFKSVGEMKADRKWKEKFAPSFSVPEDARTTFNQYMAVAKPSGSVRQHFEAHMKQMWAWIDSGLALEDATSKRASAMSRDEKDGLLTVRHILRYSARTPEGRTGVNPKRGSVNPVVEKMFETYIHDSFGHFSMSGGTMQTDMSIAEYYKIREMKNPTA
ncbi:T6SS phospholipase effector Tle1-like catalytic domain-containing protein [Jeongeupia naejangsanensis]|uniref:DUF2235 domain-containing protein n=1 Tax=Jeongeupia naejangsanensis TaxID=613195 RepID=A0ABS2BQH1_9NEIS|nr:DUF2235 domain-containing protein [Jeongeupia naejangsanensis]MBM3117879.1 DUF2235 domain-containing protein [Jeongeupia naejangsanensis]